MTLPKKQGYLPTASHLISSVKPTFIPSQKYCKEDILLHPLCITLLCEKYKLKTLLNDIIGNKKGSKQLNVVSMKQIESNIELQRSRTGKKCLKWNDKKSLDLLMLNLVNEAVLNQKLLEETLKKDSVLKSDKLIDILKDSFRKLNRSVYSHKRANDNASGDSSSNYTRNLKRSRLSPDATTYLLKWFELNCLNPYPNREQKQEIAKKTGLTPKQVRNWFTNIRKRHYTPTIRGRPPRSAMDASIANRFFGATKKKREWV